METNSLLGDSLFNEEEIKLDDILKLYIIGKDQEILFQGKTLSEILKLSSEEAKEDTLPIPQSRREPEIYV